MKNGTIKFWWMNEGKKGKEEINKECRTVLDALWLYHCQSIKEVHDENISFNTGSIMYYNEEFLKPEYECDDGFVDFYTIEGITGSEILDETYSHYDDIQEWYHTTKEQIKEYMIGAKYEPEDECIKMY